MSKDIRIYENGQLVKEYLGVHNDEIIHNLVLNQKPNAEIHFSFDEFILHEPVWTGKIVCVSNCGQRNFTPGKIYTVTTEHVYDNSKVPYGRSDEDDYTFKAGTFEQLRKDFEKIEIEIIEYKGKA